MIIQRLGLSMVAFGIFLVQEIQSTTTAALQHPINGIGSVIDNPSFWLLVTVYAVFNAAVSAMPTPESDPRLSGLFYRWAFTFLHAVSMNFIQAFGAKMPTATNDKKGTA